MKAIRMLLLLGTLWSVSDSHATPTAKVLSIPLDRPPTALLLTPTFYVTGTTSAVVSGVTGAGEVRVYDRFTGKLRRALRPSSPVLDGKFGWSLAQAGDQLLVGVPGANRVDVFSLASGAFLASLTPTGAVGDGAFGFAMEVEGPRVCIGANNDNSARGAVYVFDLKSRLQLHKLVAADAALGDSFGNSVACSGGLVVIGSPGDDHGAQFNGGSAYLFDAVLGTQISKFIASDMDSGRLYGLNVKLRGERAFVSAIKGNNERGAVSYVDAPNALEILQVLNPESKTDTGLFGYHMALDGNLLAVSNLRSEPNLPGHVRFFDSTSGLELGQIKRSDSSVLVQTPLTLSLQGNSLAAGPSVLLEDTVLQGAVYSDIASLHGTDLISAKGSPSLLPGVNIGSPLRASLSANGTSPFIASATGSATGGNKKQLYVFHAFSQILSGSNVSNLGVFKAFNQVTQNVNNAALLQLELSPAAGTAAKRQGLGAFGTFPLFVRTGEALGSNPNHIATQFHAIRQSSDSTNTSWGLIYRLKTVPNVLLSNQDSGARAAGSGNAEFWNHQEGEPAPTNPGDPVGPLFGEFVKRLSLNDAAAFTTALANAPVGTAQALFRRPLVGAVTCVARQGNTAEGTSGAVFSSFLSEIVSTSGLTVFRASLKGGAVTTSNNEGIWRKIGASPRSLVARKGGAVEGLPGAEWKKFLRYWALGNQIMILGQIKGSGINAANDTVLMLLQENDVWVRLLREGDLAAGCDDARIGSLQRVEVDPTSGRYAILTTLLGAAAKSNLALLVGGSLIGSPINESGRRLPHLLLRKGTLHQTGFSSLGAIRSLTIPGPIPEAAGASGIGEGRCVNGSGTVQVNIDYGATTQRFVKASLP
jgi:hypothetical protein